MYKLTIGPLETIPAFTEIQSDVNSVLAKDFEATVIPSGAYAGWLKITNSSNAAMGGGLAGWKLPFPNVGSTQLTYAGLDLNVLIPDADYPFLARMEIDTIAVANSAPASAISTNPATWVANKADTSAQCNQSENWMWQVDQVVSGGYKWTDTGVVLTPPSNQPFSLSFRYKWDFANGNSSVISVAQNGVLMPIPAAMQGIALQTSNWASVIAVQLQTEILQAGGLSVLYKNIFLTLSDQPF